MDVVINAFPTREEAKAFFENNIKESQKLDGIMFKSAGFYTYSERSVPKQELNEAEMFVIVFYPRGTGYEIDSGAAADAADDAADDAGSAPDDHTGPEI